MKRILVLAFTVVAALVFLSCSRASVKDNDYTEPEREDIIETEKQDEDISQGEADDRKEASDNGTVSSDAEAVQFEDKAIENAVRQHVGKSTGTILKSDLTGIKSITIDKVWNIDEHTIYLGWT